MQDIQAPIPTQSESIERYTVRAHMALLQAVPDPDQRNEIVWDTWRRYRGETEVEQVASQSFDPERYEHERGVCVFAEHKTVGRDGKPRDYKVRDLVEIARTNNRLAADRKMFAAISDGHTSDDRNAERPRVLGWTGNVRLGMVGRQKPTWALFTDEWRNRAFAGDFAQRPTRSVELLNVPGVGKYFYPIAALQSEAPRLPLPHRYAVASIGGVEIERYSYTFAPERYATPTEPAAKSSPADRIKEMRADKEHAINVLRPHLVMGDHPFDSHADANSAFKDLRGKIPQVSAKQFFKLTPEQRGQMHDWHSALAEHFHGQEDKPRWQANTTLAQSHYREAHPPQEPEIDDFSAARAPGSSVERYDLAAGPMTQPGANTGYVPNLNNRKTKRDKHCATCSGKYDAAAGAKPTTNPPPGHPFWKLSPKEQKAVLERSTANIRQVAADIRNADQTHPIPKFQATPQSGDSSMPDLASPAAPAGGLDDATAKRIVDILFQTPIFQLLDKIKPQLEQMASAGSPLGADKPMGSDIDNIPAADPAASPEPVAPPPGGGPAAPPPGGPPSAPPSAPAAVADGAPGDLPPEGEEGDDDDLSDLLPEGEEEEGAPTKPDGDETDDDEPPAGATPPKDKESYTMPATITVERYAALEGQVKKLTAAHQHLLADYSRAQSELAALTDDKRRAGRKSRIIALAQSFPGLVDTERYEARFCAEKMPADAEFEAVFGEVEHATRRAAMSSEHTMAILDPGAPPKPEKYSAAEVAQINRVAVQLYSEASKTNPSASTNYDEYRTEAIKRLNLAR